MVWVADLPTVEDLLIALAERDAVIAARDARIAELEAQLQKVVDDLETIRRKLGQNSGNSNLPPSSDGPGGRSPAEKNKEKADRKSKKSGAKRKRGGQPGHRGSYRKLIPLNEVDEVVDLFPPECGNCWKPLPETKDPDAKRFQSTELPPIKPVTTEYRRHSVCCPNCSFKTTAAHDTSVIPASPFGPRLMSVIAMLTGVYHLSRRKTATLLSDLVGVRISIGAITAIENRVSKAVKAGVDEAWAKVAEAKVKHTDGTSWLQAGKLLSLWTVATSMATVFKIVKNGKRETLKSLFPSLRGILVSDRATALKFWAMKRRQICWAHIIRKFEAFSSRDGPAGKIGQELLDYSGIIFQYWNDHKEGHATRKEFQTLMEPVRQRVEEAMQSAVDAEIAEFSGSCADMLAHRDALWTFVDRVGVEPTNNHAEQELRSFVLWRKRSFGTQSDKGNEFAERLMTIAHTARKQDQHVLGFLTACCTPRRSDEPAPSLFQDAAAA